MLVTQENILSRLPFALLQLFHGKHELFTSDHVDEVEVGTIKHKCQVLSLESYQGLPRPVDENVFYTRALYSVSSRSAALA